MSAAEYSRIVRDGRVEAAAERARRGVQVGAPVAQENAAAGPAGAGAVAAAAPGAMVPGGPLQPGGEAVYDPDTLYWLAAESLEGVSFGDAVPGVVAAAVAGAKAVHTFPSGRAVFVECVYGRDREQFLLRPGGWDFRCTPISLDSLGRPEVSLKDAAQKSFQKQVRWTMTGPRTTKWCLNYLVVEGLGLEGHHERVRTLCKLDSASWGMQEHFQVSMFLRYCLQIDQLNSHNLMAVEAMFRRLQTIEFGYSEKVREVEAKGTGGRLAMEEQQVFGGLTRLHLPKNLRKAREERELARKKRGGKGGQVPLARRVSRGCRQRIGLKNHKVEDVNAATWALNSMYNGAGVTPLGGGPANSFDGTSAAQAEVIHRIQHAVEALGAPPSDLTVPEALRSLRCGGYTDLGQSVGALTNYQPDLVSLPEAGWQPINLDALGGKVRGRSISSFIQEQLLPAETAHMKVKDSGVERPYSDPRFRDPRVYGDFVSRLLQSSIVDLSMQDGRERVGLFFVSKKANKLRLIIDARRSNAHFRPPSYVHLATGDSLSRLEVDPETELTICTADLKDAFYHLSLPEELRTYFTLAPIDGKFLSVKEVGGQRVKPGVMYYPRLAVVPMGWSWALYICQTLHENLVAQAGLGDDIRLRDKRPCPTSGYVHTEYVDNLVLIGTCREQVVSAFQHAVNALKDAGLQVHEDEVCEGDTCVLGWQFTRDGKFGPSSRRVWKVRFAIRGVIARRRATGREIERIVGHASFICLARRESLSIFGEVYRFIQRHRNHSGEVRLPRLVRHELELWSAVSPLIRVDLQAQWSSDVTAVDASFFGFGAVTSKMPLDLVRSLGRWNERWRFADEDARKARDLAKGSSHTSIMFEDEYPGLSGHQPLLVDTDAFELQEARFQNVPFEVVDREWTTLISHRWRRVPTLPVGEARGGKDSRKRKAPQMAPPAMGLTEVASDVMSAGQRKQARKGARLAAGRPGGTGTVLEQASISAACRRRYQAIWDSLRNQVLDNHGRLKDMEAVDEIVTSHLEELYMDGEDLSMGQYTVAAIQYFNPVWRGPLVNKLPRVKQSLTGWRRLAPAKSRLPVPYEVVALMATKAFKCKLNQIGLYLLLAFALYLRPSEGLRLRVQDMVRPTRQRGPYSRWTFVLHPTEGQVPSKTQEYDESLQLDLDYHRGLGEALYRCLKLGTRSPHEIAFNLETEILNKFLAECSLELSLKPLGHMHLYRLRHGGASHDFAAKHRDLAAIQMRGRWRSATSVRRYQKGGRLVQLFNSLTKDVRKKATQAAEELPQVLRCLR
ncbi:hypothetical protein AK812_SmicGene10971 [Symbiodinium microadriaticum]|uniref:Reverse transcriptase domain-containing protein n=1 Tax=Symbiodinium microadriaticum TaxID=2951 RepID=A0A1Q9EED9_SYMMI|nr:hypothetical protein AK812_SmicGene10971 [Symbiodinium microadriaticum]